MASATSPTSLAEALRALAEDGALPVAGCTDLLAGAGLEPAARAVDLLRVPELRGIAVAHGRLDVGATTTFAELQASALVREHAPVLCEVAATIGARQIQNRATLGGNIANASPAGDSLPVLLALDAELVLAGAAGERTLPYAEMHTGYRETALAPGELIRRVRIPLPAAGTLHRFTKVGTRAAQAISKVSLALSYRLADGVLRDVRIAAGSVAAVPLRLADAEACCEGQAPTAGLALHAGRIAAESVTPIDDVRSTAGYRRFALARILRRALLELAG